MSLNLVTGSIPLNIFTGALSMLLSWSTMVLLVNDTLCFPTRQQWTSLVFYGLVEASIIVQARLIFGD